MASTILDIIVQAVDQASAVFEKIGGSIGTVTTEADAQAASFAELSAMQGMTTEQADAFIAAQSGAAEATQEATVAMEEMGTSSDYLANQLERLPQRLLIYGALYGTFNFLKTAVKDAEAANVDFANGEDNVNQRLQTQQTLIGDQLLPTIVSFKNWLADLGDQATATGDDIMSWGEILFDAGKAVQIFGTELLALINNTVDLGKIGGANVKIFVDALYAAKDAASGDLKAVGADMEDITLQNARIQEYQSAQTLNAVQSQAEIRKILGETFNAPTGTGLPDKNASAITSAMDSMRKTNKDSLDAMVKDTEDFVDQAAQLYDNFQSKVDATQKNISDLTASYNADKQSRDESYQSAEVSLYEKHAEKLQKAQTDLQDKLASGKGISASDYTKLTQTIETETAILNQHQDLKSAATADAAKSDFDKLKEKYDKEQKAADDAYQKKLTAYQQELGKEQAAFDDAKKKLVDATEAKYNDLAKKVDDGYSKIISDVKIKGKQLQEAEAEALGAKTALAAGEQTALGEGAKAFGGAYAGTAAPLTAPSGPTFSTALPGAPAAAGTAPTNTISIMQGATINVKNEQDAKDLASKVSTALAQALQAQRLGLSTTH